MSLKCIPPSRTFHICFVAPSAWPVLSGDRSITTVGGSEVQQSTLACAMVAQGHRVSMICMDYGQRDDVVINGVRVLKAHSPKEGIRFLRFIHPRLSSLWRAMRDADADVYYQQNCGVLTGIVAAFCRRYGRVFVYSAASNADFDPRLPLLRATYERRIFSWGLQRADRVIVQNEVQQTTCQLHFKKRGVVLPSCYAPHPTATNDPNGYVLWVSTLRRLKRPELFLQVASRLPDHRFRMVGGPAEPEFYRDIRDAARKIPNLDFVGFVPHADIEQVFDGARVFINTSEWEGFPNTFLQSWARGIPTISFLDVGCTIDGAQIVQQVHSLDEMVDLTRALMTNDSLWFTVGERSVRYFGTHHDPMGVAALYTTVICDALQHRHQSFRSSSFERR